MVDTITKREEINQVCIGYSGEHHWQFFRYILANPEIKNICIIGVYYGRDIAYIKAILQELGRNDCIIVGVDKFEDKFCADWPEEKRNLTWQEAGFGDAPDLNKTRANLLKLGLSSNVFLVSDYDVNFLKNTTQVFDLIYIDTSHDYESVKNLINLALTKVKPNGFLAGDDFSDEGTWGVARAVRESFPKFELFSNWIWLAKVSDLRKQNHSEINNNQIKSNQIKSPLN
jgi:hypothetical protein